MHNLLAKIQKPFSHKKVLKDYKHHFNHNKPRCLPYFTTFLPHLATALYSGDTNGIKADALPVLRVLKQRVSV